MAGGVESRSPGRALRRRALPAKHFYASALSAAERTALPAALEIEGMDEEIAVLRLRLRQALEERPSDFQLMLRGVELVTRAVAARYRLSQTERAELNESAVDMLRSIGRELLQAEGGSDE